jgi:NAD+ synthase (glutamine-hydrolysing)
MRIALAQLNPLSGDIAGNTRKIVEAIADARARGAELLVAPEMVVPGYCTGDLVEDADFLTANERAIHEIANAAHGITAVVGFIDADLQAKNDSGSILRYNAAAVVRNGQVFQRTHKALLPNYRYFDDKRWFTPGDRRDPVDVIVGQQPRRLGVSIC